MEPQTPTERMIQEYVPGKQVTLAHLIANPGKDLFKKLGLPDAVSAIGILTITPSEASIIACDIATKSGAVEIGFLDRFTGAVVLTGDVSAVEYALRQVTRTLGELMRFTAFVSFPAMLGLAIVSQELIVISITEKWLPCVPVMQILCVWGAFMPISTLYSNLMNSIGRPNVYLWNTIALGIFQLLCVWGSYPYGLNIMLIVYTAANIFWLLIWHYFAHKHIGISLLNTLKDIAPYLIISVAVMTFTYWVAGYVKNIYLSLLVKIALAASLYIFLMWSLKSTVFRESLQYLFKKKTIQ